MKTIALEDLVTDVILSFCENLAELGMPRVDRCGNHIESDRWFRELSPKKQRKVSGKLLDIMERKLEAINE